MIQMDRSFDDEFQDGYERHGVLAPSDCLVGEQPFHDPDEMYNVIFQNSYGGVVVFQADYVIPQVRGDRGYFG